MSWTIAVANSSISVPHEVILAANIKADWCGDPIRYSV